MSHALVLNSDYTPIGLMPLSTMTWSDAVKATYTSAVKAVHFYENWVVRSPSVTMRVPSVVVMRRPYVNIKRNVSHRFDNAFLRDLYTCQYCGSRLTSPTADHVRPSSQGGSSRLDNIATACLSCNLKKANRHEMQPKTRPYVPSYYELVKKTRSYPITIPHESWSKYIGWDEKLIRLVEPRGFPGYLPLNT